MDDQPTSLRDRPERPRASARAMGQAAVQRVDAIEHGVVDLPVIGTVRLPAPEHIAYYGAIGLLVALEVIDWPVAVLIAGGHALANRQHGRTIQELAEALEDA